MTVRNNVVPLHPFPLLLTLSIFQTDKNLFKYQKNHHHQVHIHKNNQVILLSTHPENIQFEI